MSTGGDIPPTSGDGSTGAQQPPFVPVSSAPSTTTAADMSGASGSGIPTSAAGGEFNVNKVPATQPAFVTDPAFMGTIAAAASNVFVTNPNIMGTISATNSNMVGGNAVASLLGGGRMTPQLLPGSVMGGGGEGFIVLGQAEPVRDPQSLLPTPPSQ